MIKLKRQGQSTLEYTTLIVIILGAFLAVGTYFKRGIQGRWKTSVDELGDQYDPRTADTHIKHSLESNTDTQIITTDAKGKKGFVTTRTDNTNSIEWTTGNAEVGGY